MQCFCLATTVCAVVWVATEYIIYIASQWKSVASMETKVLLHTLTYLLLIDLLLSGYLHISERADNSGNHIN